MDDTTADRLAERVGRYVRRHLLRDETVHIPGLGSFTVIQTPAQMDSPSDEATTLQPPQFDLKFTPDA